MAIGFKKKARILIFGTGAGGVNFYKTCRGRFQIEGFVDNNVQKQGQQLFGKFIYAPRELVNLEFDTVIIASDYHGEIYPQLVELGICEAKIDVFHHQIHQRSSPVQRLGNALSVHLLELICWREGWISDLAFSLFSRTQSGQQRALKRVRLQWLDETDEFKVHVLRPAISGEVQGPRFIGQHIQPTPVTYPEIALHRMRQGQVGSVSRSVILPDGRVVIERVTTVKARNADYSVAHIVHHGKRLVLVARADVPVHIEKGILINCGSETNYYHWVMETLSQLQFVATLPEQFADYPILISRRSQTIPSIRALIDSFGIDRPFVYLDTLPVYTVDDLLFINAPNNMIPNFKNSGGNLTDSNFARPESVYFLRRHGRSLTQDIDPGSLPKRVFLARKGFLRRFNQAEIINLVQPYGFTSVHMEELDVSHQVAVMANAEMIIGPTGAAWTNIMFASNGAQALCWMAEEYGNLSCFSNLASIVGVDMEFITYPTGARDSRELYYKGYHLDVSQVKAWLQHHLPGGPGQ
ncbi:glycosyltransferase family 61 protein [Pseudomonas sp. SLFW]|uniref:glycosyltransferase family 61 protein n=1 Tax=Pseudomonas sp. SLFW TaxID=2683259 RepID=UPI0014120123|nr:glycosyltransferase family 61 protein [Pseudomonas sp. SLFW]NBB10633.1 DUF563 domain-containing protein [Pseudomonas sp. SLFW]